MPTQFSNVYPPKNRKPAPDLGVLDIEISWKAGKIRFTPNDAAKAGVYESLELGEPEVPSVLTGQPGYLYRTNEIELALTREELYRFLRHDLYPEEFFALADQFGAFFEIHDDFYDEETGEAVQPNEKQTGQPPKLH